MPDLQAAKLTQDVVVRHVELACGTHPKPTISAKAMCIFDRERASNSLDAQRHGEQPRASEREPAACSTAKLWAPSYSLT